MEGVQVLQGSDENDVKILESNLLESSVGVVLEVVGVSEDVHAIELGGLSVVVMVHVGRGLVEGVEVLKQRHIRNQ